MVRRVGQKEKVQPEHPTLEDVFIASSMNYPWRYGLNSVLLNLEGKRFEDAELVPGGAIIALGERAQLRRLRQLLVPGRAG